MVSGTNAKNIEPETVLVIEFWGGPGWIALEIDPKERRKGISRLKNWVIFLKFSYGLDRLEHSFKYGKKEVLEINRLSTLLLVIT